MKERIIGATVLVLFVVLIVPVFLDGPENDDEVISQTVPLPGQEGSEHTVVVLHRDRDHPQPVANTSKPVVEEQTAPEPPEAEPQTTESTPDKSEEEQPAVAEQTIKAPAEDDGPVSTAGPTQDDVTSSTGMWAVQLGSFGNQDNANKLAADLRKQNFTAFLSKLSTGNGELHRVRIGPQKDRESAEKVAEQLAKAGHKGQVVPHP